MGVAGNIRKLFIQLNTTQTVVLHWVKAHNGIVGNEIADRAAKLGHSLDKSVLYPLHREELSFMHAVEANGDLA